jgi:hypothetical protein
MTNSARDRGQSSGTEHSIKAPNPVTFNKSTEPCHTELVEVSIFCFSATVSIEEAIIN